MMCVIESRRRARLKWGKGIFLKFTKLNFMFKIFKVAKHGLNLQMSKFSS